MSGGLGETWFRMLCEALELKLPPQKLKTSTPKLNYCKLQTTHLVWGIVSPSSSVSEIRCSTSVMLVLQQNSFELLEMSLDLYLDFFGLEWSAKGSRCNCTFLCIHGQKNSTTFFCAYIHEIAEETPQLLYMSMRLQRKTPEISCLYIYERASLHKLSHLFLCIQLWDCRENFSAQMSCGYIYEIAEKSPQLSCLYLDWFCSYAGIWWWVTNWHWTWAGGTGCWFLVTLANDADQISIYGFGSLLSGLLVSSLCTTFPSCAFFILLYLCLFALVFPTLLFANLASLNFSFKHSCNWYAAFSSLATMLI